MGRHLSVSKLKGEVEFLRGEIRKRDEILAHLPPEVSAGLEAVTPGEPEQLALPMQRHFPLADFAVGRGSEIDLPETIEDVAESIGRYSAVRLSEALQQSGARSWRRSVYVPKRLPEDHRLVGILGREPAHRLSRSHANMILELPVCAELRRAYQADVAHELFGRGASLREVASELGVLPETVRDLISRRPRIAHEGSTGGT